MENSGEKALKEQIDFLLAQYASGSIDIHELMKLIDMAYGDYIDFHPEECPSYYDREDQHGIRTARKRSNDRSERSDDRKDV